MLTDMPSQCYSKIKIIRNILSNQGKSLFLLPLFLFMGLDLKTGKTITMCNRNPTDEVGRKSFIENELSRWSDFPEEFSSQQLTLKMGYH